jgi:hypothetical protein
MDLPAVVAFGTAERLAVDGDRRRRWAGWSWSESHAPITAASAVGSTRPRVRRMVASAGTTHRSGASRRAPSAARTGWGASAAHSAIAATDRAPARTAAAARAQSKDRDQRMPAAAGPPWVVDRGEVGEQTRRVGWSRRIGVGQLGQRGWDRG